MRKANVHLSQVNQTLHLRTVQLADANRQFETGNRPAQGVEESLRNSEQHYSRLLEQSRHQQEQLRHLAHHFLSALEEERREISRELHDEIAQT